MIYLDGISFHLIFLIVCISDGETCWKSGVGMLMALLILHLFQHMDSYYLISPEGDTRTTFFHHWHNPGVFGWMVHTDTSSFLQIIFKAVNSPAYFTDINMLSSPDPPEQKKSLFRTCPSRPQRKREPQGLKLAPFCKMRPWHYSKSHDVLETRCAVKNNRFHFYNT